MSTATTTRTLALNNGIQMPALGFGLYQASLDSGVRDGPGSEIAETNLFPIRIEG